ncbi:MAG: SIS domain-containing protein [bacterium]|nr:SIS domain-containing protein [bacterium]
MSQIKEFFQDSNGVFTSFFSAYTKHFFELTHAIDVDSVEKFASILLEARERDATIFIIGNGGSAATASHLAEDLALCSGAGEDKPFRALSLCDSVAYISAIGNDESYDKVFVGQLRNLFRTGDILVALSASGNSQNIIRAIDYINSKGGQTIGILGFDGGEAKNKCHHTVTVVSPKGHYGPVESLHLLLIHVVSNYLFFRLNGEISKP